MMYCQDAFAFVHLPRTGGNSITGAVASAADQFPMLHLNLGRKPWHFRRHATARQMREMIPDWNGIYRFGVMRNSYDLIDSSWRMMSVWREDLERLRTQGTISEAQTDQLGTLESQEVGRSFEQFVHRHYVYLHEPQGFYRHWFCDEAGDCLLSEVHSFSKLREDWPRIWSNLQALHNSFRPELPHCNGCPGASRGVWTAQLHRFVDDVLIADDLTRFSFQFPPHLPHE